MIVSKSTEYYLVSACRKAKIREAFRHFDKDHAGSVRNEDAAEIMQVNWRINVLKGATSDLKLYKTRLISKYVLDT